MIVDDEGWLEVRAKTRDLKIASPMLGRSAC